MSRLSQTLLRAGVDVAAPLRGSWRLPDASQPPAPAPEAEMLRLYYAVQALQAADRPIVVQFVAAHAGAGTSTLARGFAAAAAAECGRPVLLLSCDDGCGPAPLARALRAGLPLAEATRAVPGSAHLRRAALGPAAHPLQGMTAAEVGSLLDALRRECGVTVIDSPAASAAPDSLALSRFCDGTLLVVQAEATPGSDVAALKAEIERMGGQVIGAVMNRRRRSGPAWLHASR